MKIKLLAVVILSAALTGCGLNPSPGDGEKIGQIVKVQKRGLFWKTWEAELIRGGMNGGCGSFGTTPFEFTIENDETAKAAITNMETQTEVVIKYRMEGIYSITRSESSGHFLNSMTPARAK